MLSDTKYGVSCRGGRLGITLHKSGTHPDARGDNGISFFKYAIYPHLNELGMDTIKNAYSFNYSPVLTARRDMSVPYSLTGDESVVVETVKHGEDGGIVLRMYEALGATANVTISSAQREIVECNILEDEKCCLGKETARVTFTPFEIKTIKLK